MWSNPLSTSEIRYTLTKLFIHLSIFKFALEYESEVIENEVTTVITNVQLHSFNEVVCCITAETRRKRSTETNSIAQRYSISLSNDGENFGESTSIYILDTACQEAGNNTNGTTAVLLKVYD